MSLDRWLSPLPKRKVGGKQEIKVHFAMPGQEKDCYAVKSVYAKPETTDNWENVTCGWCLKEKIWKQKKQK